jgi:hypothetical protein
MDNKTVLFQRGYINGIFRLLTLLSICLYPHQLAAQKLSEPTKSNATTYEDDRIKIIVRSCNRKQQELICQAVLTSKNSDLIVDLDGNNIKLVDFEGNEYYPSSVRLANRNSENNLIRTELVENVPFKASFIFAKIPINVTKIALFQIPLSGEINTTAKFRNLTAISPKISKSIEIPTPTPRIAKINSDSSDRSICPDATKILYRATSKHYLMYICGGKIPSYYVGLARDGSQGITLRLRYYDRTQFSADNGETNYTIAANWLTIRKDRKIIYQEKIQVLQPLAKLAIPEDPTPATNSKKNLAPSPANPIQNRSSIGQPIPKVKR